MERYEVRDIFYGESYLGKVWSKFLGKKEYFIYDLIKKSRVYNNIPYYYRRSDALKTCAYLNTYEKAANYRAFIDGNGKYFVCYKSTDKTSGFKVKLKEIEICYFKIGSGEDNFSYDSPFIKKSILVSPTGEETLQEVCDLLYKINGLEQEIEKQKEKVANSKIGTPVSCL